MNTNNSLSKKIEEELLEPKPDLLLPLDWPMKPEQIPDGTREVGTHES